MSPVLELDPAGGQVVITRFACGTFRNCLVIAALHVRIKRAVSRRTRGYRGVRLYWDLRRRTIYSVSLWNDMESIYSMGNVPDHVAAVRIPAGLGVSTRCGVFCYSGDWKRAMFGSPASGPSPLSE